ncbi:MAG: hypothetical protein LBC41_01685 [Clostridiales bacterium]|nr:hypothetical protein [Clostridiales bacterium]
MTANDSNKTLEDTGILIRLRLAIDDAKRASDSDELSSISAAMLFSEISGVPYPNFTSANVSLEELNPPDYVATLVDSEGNELDLRAHFEFSANLLPDQIVEYAIKNTLLAHKYNKKFLTIVVARKVDPSALDMLKNIHVPMEIRDLSNKSADAALALVSKKIEAGEDFDEFDLVCAPLFRSDLDPEDIANKCVELVQKMSIDSLEKKRLWMLIRLAAKKSGFQI